MSETITLARKAGIEWQGGFVRVAECVTQPMLERFAALVAAAEREACAKVADEYAGCLFVGTTAEVIAAAIRARGNT